MPVIPIRGLRAPVSALPSLPAISSSAASIAANRVRWTADMDDELRRRWTAGQPGSQIAAALGHGLSRSAIFGRVNRLGLKRRESPIGERWG